jgi:DNA-binding response OmpR family regulator
MRVLVVEDVESFADEIAEGLRDEAMAVDLRQAGVEPLRRRRARP